ncbi:GntR family transcriptional regulator [Cupriavidus basilensis]|uniref:GntR family transcriptional regulator n=1 Tax=Cupriavidus basilensis TaxID=68895 RepID=A0ABT6AG34_9BURK|nr:GntR family transcriptional regulator [Cupriavidus basilensis]MDF3831561.1 GntR family transcriptional regulator [Cupriavidus basilensis]
MTTNIAPQGTLRTTGIARHRQIFLVLRDGITQGAYQPGSALPNEEALVKLFGVARATVRRALADLESEGLVQRRHGSGTYVRGDQLPTAGTPTLSYIDELKMTAQATQVRVVSVETRIPPLRVSAALKQPGEEPAVCAIRLRVAGDTPLMLTEAWTPQSITNQITEAALKRRAMYELLLDQGVEFGRVVQQISAESADPIKAKLLQCEVGTALIRLTRLLHDRSGRPVQLLTAHLTPQHSQILMDIPAEAINTLSGGHIAHDPTLLATRTQRKR